jgi:type IV secretory pathway TrbD component
MSPIEIIALIVLAAYAVYRQTTVNEVREQGRFKLAAIYGVIGIAVGGFALPHGAVAIGLLGLSIALSAVIGVARGYQTRIWRAEDGRVLARGTVVTIALFVGLIAAKFGIGTYEYLAGVRDSAGFGEVLLMIGVMVAVQAQIIWIRARGMVSGAGSRSESRPVLETASV